MDAETKSQTLEAYESTGGNKAAAAKLLGIPITTFKDRYKRITKDDSVIDLERFVPEGQKLKSVSTLYKDGKSVVQWVKTDPDLARQLEIIKAAAESLKEDIPRERPLIFCGKSIQDLLSLYVITDFHIGQMSWAAEVGEDWDTDKAVAFLVKWMGSAIRQSPDSKTGVLCQLGDFLHFDSMEAVTPTSKHLLDADSRYAKVVGAAIKALRIIIGMMLEKHEHVHIIMAEGNHDMASSIWLRAFFADKYEDEPRVTVDNTALPYYVYEWGSTSLFFHHGHKNKMSEISRTFAGMYRDVFGRTKYSYAHMGHYHHIALKEDALMLVEQHPTMAVKDAYSARGGYISNRGASVITYHKNYGEVSRATTRPEMLE